MNTVTYEYRYVVLNDFSNDEFDIPFGYHAVRDTVGNEDGPVIVAIFNDVLAAEHYCSILNGLESYVQQVCF